MSRWWAVTVIAVLMAAGLGAPARAGSTTVVPPPSGVDSPDYIDDGAPRGGVGVPGTFHVTAPTTNADEVREYAYSLDSGVVIGAETVPARATDHGASITLAPRHSGINVLHVWSIDHAGRYSSQVTYTFAVRAGLGPAANWTFEGTSQNVTDASGNGNTLNLGGTAGRVAGRSGVGSALSLPGTAAATRSDPINAPHPFTGVSTPVRTDASFTVTAWARISSTSGGGAQTVVSASGSRISAYRLGYTSRDDRWQFSMASADSDLTQFHGVRSDAAPNVGRWTHLAGVFDAATKEMTLYVNGVVQAQTATLVDGFDASVEVAVGKHRWHGGDDGFFTGDIDDVRFYPFVETSANLAGLAVPLPPTITFPYGAQATVGGQVTVLFGAGGDRNVTGFRYGVDGAEMGDIVELDKPGGAAIVAVDAGSVTGERVVHAVALDDGNRVSLMSGASFTVTSTPRLSGTVWDATFMPKSGAVVQLQPGGYEVTSAPDGSYTLTGFPAGPYTITVRFDGRCVPGFHGPVEIYSSGLTLDIYLSDDSGGTCSDPESAR
ncbi:LamG-like jellyroll fold domain-containing protein [Micromonospora sp. LOL_024]|uniref:LamG-like jellyroll fold domain-containing protein n=1 Tax=Micromonospora sp. LOL_024 TaxID=3345412 RepID=UPI003A860722